jgi:hypothetical protein
VPAHQRRQTPVPPTLAPTSITRDGSMKFWYMPQAATRTMSSAMCMKPTLDALPMNASPNACIFGSAGVAATFAPLVVQIDFPWPRRSNASVATPSPCRSADSGAKLSSVDGYWCASTASGYFVPVFP